MRQLFGFSFKLECKSVNYNYNSRLQLSLVKYGSYFHLYSSLMAWGGLSYGTTSCHQEEHGMVSVSFLKAIQYILVAIKFLNAVVSLCDSHWRIFSGLDLHLYHILCQLVVCWLNLIYWEQGIHPSEALNEYQTKPFLPLHSARCASIFVVIHTLYNSHFTPLPVYFQAFCLYSQILVL